MSPRTAWLLLVVAGLLEAGFATALKLSESLTRPVPTLLFFALASVSFMILTRVAQVLPLGTAYAVWTGIGAAGTVIVGILAFEESASAARLAFLALLIGAVAGLKFVDRDDERPGAGAGS